jgi:hypothetical protein
MIVASHHIPPESLGGPHCARETEGYNGTTRGTACIRVTAARSAAKNLHSHDHSSPYAQC